MATTPRQGRVGDFLMRLTKQDSLETFLEREKLAVPILVQTRSSGPDYKHLAGKRSDVRVDTVCPGSSERTQIVDLLPFQFPVYRMQKREGTPWDSFVTLGRANNNDIVINNPAMPKVGAMFYRTSDAWSIQVMPDDGAHVDGVLIEKSAKIELMDSFRIVFGGEEGLSFEYYTPKGYFNFLQSQR